MVPKLHPKGSSFKGAAAYLLHDKDRADTDDRVEWTETRNLAVHNPETAWKIMAATALDQDRLKEQAGIKNTGRKSNKCALHFSLSWHPDQTPDRDEMLLAADGAIDALGASKHQALIVAHNDEAHSHIHILLNRVSPEDGRHLSSSKEKLNLSKWAQEYEERTGIYCENRILNNEMRGAGEYVRGDKDQARHLYEEQARAVANDNIDLKPVRAAQKAKDAALALKGRNQARMHRVALQRLDEEHRARKDALARARQRTVEQSRTAIIKAMRPDHIALRRKQGLERQTFEALEQSFFGRANNAIKTMKVSAEDVRDRESNLIKRTFAILTNAAKRQEYFERGQKRARDALRKEQTDRTLAAKREATEQHRAKIEAARQVYVDKQAELRATQAVDVQDLRQAWADRNQARSQAITEAAKIARKKDLARDDFNSAAPIGQDAKAEAFERTRARLREFNKAQQGPTREQDNKRDRDDDRER